MTSPCCGLCSTGTHDALKKNAANWVQRQSIKRSLQTGVKLRKETGASHRSATSLHALPAASCSNRLSFSPSLPCWFLPILVAFTVLSRILQHNRLPRRTLHHVHSPVPQVRVAWQVSIYLRVRPRRRHAGGLHCLRIGLCDLLLHRTPLDAAVPPAAAAAADCLSTNHWARLPPQFGLVPEQRHRFPETRC